jgi:hypothetical protein
MSGDKQQIEDELPEGHEVLIREPAPLTLMWWRSPPA